MSVASARTVLRGSRGAVVLGGLAVIALAGCAAGNRSSANGDDGPTTVPCDPARFAGQVWAAEIAPGAGSSFVDQEATGLVLDGCQVAIELGTTVQVHGQVLDPEGRNTVPAHVVASRPSLIAGRPSVVTQGQTNSGGEFVLSLPEGTHQLLVLPQGQAAAQTYPPLSAELVVEKGLAPVSLRLVPGTAVRGVVQSARAEGLEGVSVRAVDGRTGGLVSSVARTDANGAFVIYLGADALTQRLVHLVADGDALPAPLTRDVETARLPQLQDPLELQAPALPDSQTFVLPVDGLSTSGAVVPIPGARVEFESVLASIGLDQTGAVFRATGVTDEEGRAEVQLVPGGVTNRSYQVTITPPADSLFARGEFDVLVGTRGGVLGTLSLATRPSLIGQVKDASGSPVRNLVVAVQPAAGGGTNPGDASAVALPEALTDGAGRFIVRVERGDYDLDLVPAATQRLPRWSLEALSVVGDTDIGVVRLPPAISVRVSVRGPGGVEGPPGKPASMVGVRLFALPPEAGCMGGATCPTAPRLRAEGTTSQDGELQLLIGAP